MKKKVRIYKAPDGKGKFVNKTAKFLYGGMPKAQEGMQADPMAAMADYVYKTLDDVEFFEDTDEVKESLVDELTTANVPIEKAEELVNNIASQVLIPKFPEAQSEQTEEITETEPEVEEPETETDYGYYDDTVANEEDEEDYDDDDDIPEDAYMQSGGDLIPEDNAVTFTGYDAGDYVADKQQMYALGGMTKRKYIGNVMKMLKKAEEGIEAQSEEEGPTDFDPTDTMDKKKEDRNKGFVSALANSAIEAKRKEQAEAMWKEQQELMAQGQNLEMTPEGDPMARRGFATGEEYLSPRQIRRMMPRGLGRNQMSSFAGWVPPGGMFPGGINIMTMPQANMQMPEQKPIHVQGSMPGMKIDVRKSHWLTGKPSQYSIEYGGDGAIPGFGMMPGIGYGSRSTTRRTIEGVSRIVNKKADPGKNNTTVLNNNPEYDKDGNGVPDNVQSNIISSTPGTASAYDRNANNMLDVTEVKTNLPAVNNNPNKDAVGTGAKVPTKTATAKTATATKSKQAGQSKPAASAKVTNKGKATVTSSDLINKQKKSGWSNSITGSGTQPSSYDIIPQWMKDAVNNNESNESESSGSTWDMIKSYYPLTKILFEQGGFVDSSNPDLYEFIYGGADPITQQDMNYSDSKNTGSPFFARKGGNLTKYNDKGEVKDWDKDGDGVPDNLQTKRIVEDKTENKKEEPKKSEFQAITSKEDYDKRLTEEKKRWAEENTQDYNSDYNPYGYGSNFQPNMFQKYVPFNTRRKIGTWSRQVGMPYDPRTGQMVNAFGPNTNLTKIDVRKSGWLSGNPKKYTMYFNNYNVDPKLAKFLEETHGADPSKQPVKDKSKVAEDNKVTKPEDSNVVPGYEPGAYGPGFSGYNADSDGDGVPDFMQANDPQAQENKGKIGDPLSPSGPSAEEIAARDAATEANKGVIRNFSEVEGVQDDPFGIGIGGGNEEGPSDFEESTKTYDSPEAANEYIQGEWGDIMTDVAEVLGPKSQQEFDKFLATNPTKGAIDAKIEDFMRQRNEVIYKDAEAVEREDLTANAEEEMLNQEAMRRNPMFMGSSGAPAANPNFGADPMIATGSGEDLSSNQEDLTNYQDYGYGYGAPGFGDDMMGAPSIGGVSPWSIPGFDAMSDELSARPGAAPFAENIFPPTDINDPLAGYGWHSNMTLEEGREKRKAEKNAAIKKQQQEQQQREKQNKTSKQNIAQQQEDARREKAQMKRDLQDIRAMPNFQGNQLTTFAKESPRAAEIANKLITYAKSLDEKELAQYGVKKGDGEPGLQKIADQLGYGDFLKAYKSSYNSKNSKKGAKKGADPEFGEYWKRNPSDSPYNKKNFNKKYGGILNRFTMGGEDKDNNGIPDILEVGTNTVKPGSTTTSIGTNPNFNSSMFAPEKDSKGNVVIPGFNTAESQQNDKMKNSLLSYQGYGEGDEFSAAPEGSAVTVDDQGNPIVMSPDEAYRRMKEGEIAVDMENEDTYEVDSEGELDLFNYIGNAGLGKVGRYQEMQPFRNFYTANFNTDNITASQDRRDRGVYDTNSGQYKPNKQGPTDTNTTISRYGGFMQMGGWTEGDIVEMTPEEYAEFLANGGELEIID